MRIERHLLASLALEERHVLEVVGGSRVGEPAVPVGPELDEPAIALRAMPAGREVVEDYGHIGLSLRRHPVSFLREDLARRRIVTCAEAMAARDQRWLEAAGIVLVRQRPGSANGVMFITLEDETGIANLVVWQKVFERYRRVILSSSMIAVRGRAPRLPTTWHNP